MSESAQDIEFSLAVLCYGAGEEAIPFVEQLHAMMSLLSLPWEIVLVGNYWPGAEDPTPAVVAALAARLPNVRSIAREKAGGMGWDMRAGFAACRGRYLGVTDGDGQFPLDSTLACFARLRMGHCDLVKTYRVVRYDGFYRRLISAVYNRLFRLLFPRYRGHDVNSKPKILTRAAYQRLDLGADGWFIDAEIVLRCLDLGMTMSEIPTEFSALERRPSFVRIAALGEFLRDLLAYRFSARHRAAHR